VQILLASRAVPDGAKLVWLQDWVLDPKGQGCWLTDEQLGVRLGMSPRTVEKHRQQLMGAGLHLRIPPGRSHTRGWRSIVPAVCRMGSSALDPDAVIRKRTVLDDFLGEWPVPSHSESAASAVRWTYFVRAGTDGPIKIGSADDVTRRVRHLQSGHMHELRLLGRTLAIREEAAHQTWLASRIRGEWFRASPELLAWIERVCSQSDEARRSLSGGTSPPLLRESGSRSGANDPPQRGIIPAAEREHSSAFDFDSESEATSSAVQACKADEVSPHGLEARADEPAAADVEAAGWDEIRRRHAQVAARVAAEKDRGVA